MKQTKGNQSETNNRLSSLFVKRVPCTAVGVNTETNSHRAQLESVCVVSLSLVLLGQAAFAPADLEKLQKQADERVEQYRAHFYQTGDQNSLLPELEKAESELKTSYNGFLAAGNYAAAAQSEITQARIENIRSVQLLAAPPESHGVRVVPSESIGKHQDAAVQLYAAARELAKKGNHPRYEAKALVGLARTDGLDRGNLSDGLADVTEAIRLVPKTGDADDLFDALDLAAELELRRGRLAASIEYLDRALAMSGQTQKKQLVYFAYRDRADVYRNRVEVCVTEPRFEACYKALKLWRSDLEEARNLADGLGYEFLAKDTQRELREFDILEQLLKSQEEALKSSEQYFSPKSSKDVLVTEQFYFASSAGERAKVQKFIQELPGFSTSADAQSYYLQGSLREIEGNTDAALTAYLKAIELLESDRRRLRDAESRSSFLEDKIEYYYTPITLLPDRHRTAEAFDLMERSRSRGMADLLNSQPLDFATSRERELYSESEQLRAKIGAEQQKLFRWTAGGERDKHAAEISEIQVRINKLETDEQNLATRIAKEAPKLEELTVSQTATLDSAQKLAQQEGYDVLYYLAISTGIIVWRIGGDDVEVRTVFLPRLFLIDKVFKLRNSLTDRAHDERARFDEQTSRELFLYLIQPMMKWIKTRHLVIVPHEDLNYVPFQSLQDPADGTYLGEKFQITYAPSATVLASLKERPKIADGRLLAVANPGIPEAKDEVKAIGRLYPGRSKIVSETLARKEEIKAWASSYNLLHLSVHGRFDESEPLLSYLELKPTDRDDGHLTAAEMFGLPLPKGSLVVLSACETGRVTATHANELMGMVRAMLYAGANDLVLSSWEVEAGSTALWMETFYREAQTKSPSEAARLALLAVKARPEYRHPYYWSPFLLTGK